MKSDTNQKVLSPLEDDTFCFDCYPGIECFTQCCAKLRLILTPYDILRIKTHLGLPSERFLDIYTDTVFEEGMIFPLVKLRMSPDDGRCPFVTKHGCSIYVDRPGACRLYPIAKASAFPIGGHKGRDRFFIVSEPHCLGFKEQKVWTLDEWMGHEGLAQYNGMNEPWIRIVLGARSIGSGAQLDQKLKMFFMASYNLDRFRAFLFHSSFFEKFKIGEKARLKLAQDDEALLRFAFDWLGFVLLGEKTITRA